MLNKIVTFASKYPMAVATNGFGAAFWITTVTIAACNGTSTDVLICILGTTIGWWLGYIGAPFTRTEREKFGLVAKPVGLFLSGYPLSKIDEVLKHALTPAVALKDPGGPRVVYFVVAALVSAMVVFSNRLLGLDPDRRVQ